MNRLHQSRAQDLPGLARPPSQRPAFDRPSPESDSHGRHLIDPRFSGETIYDNNPHDPAHHLSGQESCFQDRSQMHDESGPQPYSPYQIPSNSEHPAFGGGTFQTPSSTQLNTSGSKGLVQSHQSNTFSTQERGSAHVNAFSGRQESSSAMSHQASGGQFGGILSERVPVPYRFRDEQSPGPRGPSSKPSLHQHILSLFGCSIDDQGSEEHESHQPRAFGSGNPSPPTISKLQHDLLRADLAATQRQLQQAAAQLQLIQAQAQVQPPPPPPSIAQPSQASSPASACAATANGAINQVNSSPTGPPTRPPTTEVDTEKIKITEIDRSTTESARNSKSLFDSALRLGARVGQAIRSSV